MKNTLINSFDELNQKELLKEKARRYFKIDSSKIHNKFEQGFFEESIFESSLISQNFFNFDASRQKVGKAIDCDNQSIDHFSNNNQNLINHYSNVYQNVDQNYDSTQNSQVYWDLVRQEESYSCIDYSSYQI